MNSPDRETVNIRSFRDGLKKRLPPGSPVLIDLLNEPDSMAISKAEILIPHHLQRLDRELEGTGLRDQNFYSGRRPRRKQSISDATLLSAGGPHETLLSFATIPSI